MNAPNTRGLCGALCLWLLHAETEYRQGVAAVQKEGSNGNRAPYAAARRDHDIATRVSEQLVTWPSVSEARA